MTFSRRSCKYAFTNLKLLDAVHDVHCGRSTPHVSPQTPSNGMSVDRTTISNSNHVVLLPGDVWPMSSVFPYSCRRPEETWEVDMRDQTNRFIRIPFSRFFFIISLSFPFFLILFVLLPRVSIHTQWLGVEWPWLSMGREQTTERFCGNILQDFLDRLAAYRQLWGCRVNQK